MLIEFYGGVIIKIKVKGYLKNITENTQEIIDTKAIKNSNVINYIIDNTKYKIKIEKDKIILTRNNNEFSNTMIFKLNKKTISEYYIIEANAPLEFNITTINLTIKENLINITYHIEETDNMYIYKLEMSDN